MGRQNFHDDLNFAVEKAFSSLKRLIEKQRENGAKRDPGIEQYKNRDN